MKRAEKIVFFGTPQFAVPFFEQIIADGYNVIAAVTAPDKPFGRKKELRPSPIKVAAQNKSIPVLAPQKIRGNSEFLTAMQDLQPDLGIVIAYGKIIPQELIDIPRLGIINIHPSQLPKYRGPSPMQYALLNGDPKTAIDIMQIDAGMDTGDILFEKEVEITSSETYITLQEKISKIGAAFLSDALKDVLDGNISPKKQNDASATYSKMISRDNAFFDARQKSAKEVVRMGKAFYPWPGLFTEFNGKRLKISLPTEIKTTKDVLPGEFFVTETGQCAIMCADGPILPETFQFEGKKELHNKDFVKGYAHLFV